MFKSAKKLLKYGRLTQSFPNKPVNIDGIIGSPEIDPLRCNGCGSCISRCPSNAIVLDSLTKKAAIHLDQCIFCVLCETICPVAAVKMTDKIELAEKEKSKLRGETYTVLDNDILDATEEVLQEELKRKIRKMFGRSLKIREVDSGSCNACDYEINGLNNPFNDIERFGISFVASPRHADMLLVTGTATRNMQVALQKTYHATPDPKLVVAVGACACSGGIFRDSYATTNGIDSLVPVDVYVPGCPPRPQAILYGILKALDRVR
ncbi:MAG: NADH-quinone oxidoreductase subunit NuoB [Eubacteriales bacterium]|nr:NADH-quinone oxidoreductase subunit NuoB [Eubacteriales bacterium]